jgi:hypothetical protein
LSFLPLWLLRRLRRLRWRLVAGTRVVMFVLLIAFFIVIDQFVNDASRRTRRRRTTGGGTATFRSRCSNRFSCSCSSFASTSGKAR